jgi:PAS domain S-box-containing protein
VGDLGDVAVDFHLPPRATSAGEARRLLSDCLRGIGDPDSIESAQMAISEIVTNALVHAGTNMQLRVLLTGEALRVELTDGSPHLPHRRDYSINATTGRGLHVVSELVDRWGAHPLGDGKVVWFEIAETPTGGSADSGPPSPLPADDDPSVVAVVEVELLNMPLLMHAAWQEHAAALLRELLLINLDEDFTAIESHAAASGALSALFEQVPPPDLPREPESIMATATEPGVSAPQLILTLPQQALDGFRVLDDMLEQAVLLAERGELLSPPTQPEVQSMRHWICDQVRTQGGGAAPVPWASPADTLPPDVVADLEWDADTVLGSGRALVAADDANRIIAVSGPALELLGYDAGQLVGRRLISLIPQRYHQAHIAGFTLHLVNGRSPLIGTRVTVPVVRADGSEVLLGLVVESRLLARERRVFTAELFA